MLCQKLCGLSALLCGSLLLVSVADAACENADNSLGKGNYIQALNYYRLCSAKGDAEATYKMATLYAKGLGVSAANKSMADKYYRKAAMNGYAPAQIMLGLGLLSSGESSSDKRIEGYSWLLLAAEKPENKWMYPLKDTAYSDKAAQYLKKFVVSLSKAEQNQALVQATNFKQQAIFSMAKVVLGEKDYQTFMTGYEKGGADRADALAGLKKYSEKYKI